MIGNDFVTKTYDEAQRCSECGKKTRTMLVSIRKGRVQKKVCSEECRLEFDNRFWQEVARKNNKLLAKKSLDVARTYMAILHHRKTGE